MNVYILYKYINYGQLNERKEVMAVCTDVTLALQMSDKFKWMMETIPSNKFRIPGGAMAKYEWKTYDY